MLAKTFGCCRYVYNWALELKEKVYKEEGKVVSEFEMEKRVAHDLKPIAPWLNEVSAKALCCAINDLYEGYRNFFGGRANKPKFRCKDRRQHYHDRPNNRGYGVKADFKNGLVSVPRIPNIPCVFHRRFTGRIKQAGIELLTSGRYYVSILVDDGQPLPISPAVEPENTLGIDTGLIHLAILSDGQKPYEHIHVGKKNERKLKLLQRQFRKKQKGSRMYKKLKLRISRLHEHISNCRKDYIHKVTHRIVSENQATTICVEDLKIKSWTRNKSLAFNVADACLGMFYNQLKYKCLWAGKNYIKIDPFAPSSKMCSCCGYINKQLTWDDREWTCPDCGAHHNRDLNAAINIKHFGLSEKSPYPRYWGKVKPAEQPLADDRSSEPKKLHRCYTARRARADEAGKLTDNMS